MTLKVILENIGGISQLALDFKKGKNLIKAPNATGKSSFVKGIELLNMSRDKIEKRRHYLNLFATAGQVRIEEDGQKICSRAFTVKTGNKLRSGLLEIS